jgi:hypothetical protein
MRRLREVPLTFLQYVALNPTLLLTLENWLALEFAVY